MNREKNRQKSKNNIISSFGMISELGGLVFSWKIATRSIHWASKEQTLFVPTEPIDER